MGPSARRIGTECRAEGAPALLGLPKRAARRLACLETGDSIGWAILIEWLDSDTRSLHSTPSAEGVPDRWRAELKSWGPRRGAFKQSRYV